MSEAISSKVTLVVEGARSLDRIEDNTCDVTLIVDKNAPLSSIWDMLKDLGYQPPVRLDRGSEYWTKWSQKWLFHPHTEVEVVGDRSAVDDTHVYINEPLVAHRNRHREITFDIADEIVSYEDDPSAPDLRANTLVIDDQLSITFHRTVRMPDDDRLHSLPASVGAFPLYNVADYAARLPESIRDKGGVFLPMWQREALWINFNSTKSKEYAIRVYLGKINAVTGKSMMEENSDDSLGTEQDYIVVPGQNWIDGVCVAPGVVRQFVAMPLGSGYTVEGQKTGEEKHGGIQLEIIPSYTRSYRNWLKEETLEVLNNPDAFLDEMKTPQELGLNLGDKILSYAEEAMYSRAHIVGDLVLQNSEGRDSDLISVKAFNLPKQKPVAWGSMQTSSSSSMLSYPGAVKAPPSRPTNNVDWNSKGGSWEVINSCAAAPNDGVAVSSEAGAVASSSAYDDFYCQKECERKGSSTGSTAGSPTYSATYSSAGNFVPCPPFMGDDIENMCMPMAASEEDSSLLSRPMIPAPPPVPSLNIKAMGLAAGGKLIQDIVSDNYPPRNWDVAAARVINVHILDPVSCEQVTHIVPPPVPMSAYKAIEAQLPFFVVEEQIDNRVEGGDFDNVKSVAQMDNVKGISGEPSSDPTASTMCQSCEKRLCDCVIRPCDHQFCNFCIQALEKAMESTASQLECPRCKSKIAHVAGFAAPMNLPGEESIRTKMPVHILKVDDGRIEFESIRNMRI